MNENTDTPINPEAGDYIAGAEAQVEEQLVDLDPIFLGGSFNRAELFAVRREIFQHEKLVDRLDIMIDDLEEVVNNASKPADKSAALNKLGFANWILNDLQTAVENFEQADDTDAKFMLSLLYLEQDQPGKALPILEKISEKDDSVEVSCALIEARTKTGEAQKTIKDAEKIAKKNSDSAEAAYQHALAMDYLGEYEEAIDTYKTALERDQSHAKSCFRLGFNLALRGEENEAIRYYERCVNDGPLHTNLLTNLGLLYEDTRRYSKAVKCFRQILAGDPTNSRARLFLKDAVASQNMEFDEEQHGELEKRSDLLEQPVSDFELSVRCRTALETIGIMTMSDLVTRTEQELLGCKNFGETSLQEIRILLTTHNLRLGMTQTELYGDPTSSGRGDTDLDKLVGDLDLSVRSRRCMERLGIVTVRDLTEKSERELLSGKNFGRTSLKEIKDKLVQVGLALAEDS